MLKIKEVIIVEGRGDVRAVEAAVEAQTIVTSGLGLSEKTMQLIGEANRRCGIIIFTDPDHAGETIRRKIAARYKDAKHAFLPKDKAVKDGDLGIENADAEDIIEALSKVRTLVESSETFSMSDLTSNSLAGSADSAHRRDLVGRRLGLGYSNAKQFLKRMNSFGITREEFEGALKEIN